MSRFLMAVAVAAAAVTLAPAAVKSKKVEYKHDGVSFAGEMYYDDASKEKRPGVLVFHEWWGLDAHAKKVAEEWAKLGYVAFAADLYGDAKLVEKREHAMEMATGLRKDVKVWRGRAEAALKQLTDFEFTDAKRVAATGYCLGGSTALQLAAAGADLKAVSTFHAGLPKFTADDAKAMKAKVQVHNGEADTFISAEAIEGFKKVLADAKVSLDFVQYKGVVHSFTVKDADAKNIPGMKYDKEADEKSWAATKKLFEETFKAK
jgi:dienelactone hydrolase